MTHKPECAKNTISCLVKHASGTVCDYGERVACTCQPNNPMTQECKCQHDCKMRPDLCGCVCVACPTCQPKPCKGHDNPDKSITTYIPNCAACQPQPTTDEWAELDKLLTNPPWSYQEWRKHVDVRKLKAFVTTHYIKKSELIERGERMKGAAEHGEPTSCRQCVVDDTIDDFISPYKNL